MKPTPDVSRLVRAITERQLLREFYQLVVEEATRVMRAKTALLTLLQPDGILDFVGVTGEQSKDIYGLRMRASDSFLAPVLESLKAVNLQSHDNDQQSESNKMHKGLGVPILSGKSCIGALAVLNPEDGKEYNEEDAEALAMISRFVPLMLQMNSQRQTSDRQEREIRLLKQFALSLKDNVHPGRIAESLATALAENLASTVTSVYIVDPDTQELALAARTGLELDTLISSEERGRLIAETVKGRKAIRYPNSANNPLPAFLPLGTRSAIIAPLVSREKFMGFVLITSLLPDAYTDADESVLTAIASQVAIALDSVFLAEDVGRGARINSQIYELSENLSEADSEEEVFSAIADAAFGLLDLDGFAAMIYDGQQLRTHFMLGLAESIYDYAPAKGQGIPGWVIEFEAPATAQDIIIDPKNQSALWPSDDASLLCVPLQRGAKSIGVLVGVSQTPRQFTIADTELFYTLAHLAAGSLKCGD